MKKNVFFFLSLFLFVFASCDDDNNTSTTDIAVAFVNPQVNLSAESTQVTVVFSSPTNASGTLTMQVEPTANLVYGEDFSTNPAPFEGVLEVPFAANATSASFTFNKLSDAFEGEIKHVKFTIVSASVAAISIPESTKSTQLNFNETAIQSNISSAENGGNTFPNGVYVDLSSGQKTAIGRTSWDLGFYAGSEFKVVLNPGINGLAVKQLNTNNIDAVQSEDASVTVGNLDPAGIFYIDNPSGILWSSDAQTHTTAIAEIAANDADNKVYLVNLGQNISDTPATASNASFTGTERGWKKIRILRSGNDYKLQYADLNATTHNEITIAKNTAFNHSFFSFNTNNVVSAEPQKEKWDLLITPFVSYTVYNGQNVSYYFGDGILSNNLSGTKVYQVLTSEFAYTAFGISNVVNANFETSIATDRRAIGTNWRATFPSASVRTDRFYVLKDPAGNIYKLKFNALVDQNGTRGTTTFEYVKLN
jgi:hypothetical protein